MEYLISSLIGYLLGSFPTAYLLLKKARNIDITKEGSGNVGAMNTFDVTRSKLLGATVLLIDALKGLLSVYISLLILPLNFIYPALALIFAVLSHCFNPWLKFKGGRGLAAAAGGTALLFPFLPVVWCIIWLISFIIKKDITFSNISATVLTLIILFSSVNQVYTYSFPQADTTSTLLLFSLGLLTIIFIKHVDPIIELISNTKLSVRDRNEQKKN